MRRDEILAWVAAHDEVLSVDLAGLSKFPIPFRKIIVERVTPARRHALWTEHLAAVAAEPHLTPEQRAFVRETAERLPMLFASPAPNPALVEWEAQAAKLFARPDAGRIFATLGPPEPPEGLPLPPDALPTRAT